APPDRSVAARPALIVGLVVLVASLVAPVVEVFKDHPNNVTLLYRYFLHGTEARVPLGSAVRESTNALTVMPYGNTSHGAVSVVIAAAVMAGIAVIGSVVARRRRQVGAQVIIVASVLAAVIGVVATTRITGGLLPYLVEWQSSVPCVLLIGFGCALFGTEPRTRPVATVEAADAYRHSNPITRRPWLGHRPVAGTTMVAALGVVTLALGAILVHYQINQSALVGVDDPVANALAIAADRAVPPGAQVIKIDIVDDPTWVYAAMVTLTLVREGHATEVSPQHWVTQFGAENAATRTANMTIALYEATDATPPPGRVVGQAGGVIEVVRSSA
ncbi:MAG: hypothetical protein M3137_07795, partial [Actinomycetota bacterium]|nr:hypothetical protein [Actinomycetota bacterium]